MTHLAYNLGTGEILTTNHGNQLKRWVARHTKNDIDWAKRWNKPFPPYRWVFAHGKDFDECIAKLTARQYLGV